MGLLGEGTWPLTPNLVVGLGIPGAAAEEGVAVLLVMGSKCSCPDLDFQ